MDINLPPEFESFIHSKIESGSYNSSDDVVREALLCMMAVDSTKQQQKALLNSEMQIGLDQLASGQFLTSDELLNELNIDKKDL